MRVGQLAVTASSGRRHEIKRVVPDSFSPANFRILQRLFKDPAQFRKYDAGIVTLAPAIGPDSVTLSERGQQHGLESSAFIS
jgi:hypothetical protein